MAEYEIERVIGCGTFGKVYLVTLDKTNYALKEINMNSLTSIEKKRAFNEVTLLSKLNHRNIIQYKDSTLDHINGKLLIVTEYAECGDLSFAIEKQKGIPFSERKTISWFIQISLALQYIHSQNILHRDLKTQNIFLCRNNTIKIGDFGIARILREDFANTGIGTPYYFSPEICMKKPYNCKSDMWALGCILFEVSALTRPFKADNFPQLLSVILEGKRKPFPRWSSDLIKQLVDDLLCFDPDQRPSTSEVLAYSSLQPYLSFYVPKNATRKGYTTRMAYRSPPDSLKRSASSASTVFQQLSLSNASKQLKFSSKTTENERKPRSTSTREASSAIVAKEYKTPKKFQKRKLSPATTRATPPTIVVTEYKTPDKPSSMPVFGSNMNVTYTVATAKEASIPTDHGYSSEETNCSTCEHSLSVLKDSPCHQCMFAMMWKNRIRGCVGNKSDYLKLKKKLLLIFKHDLFQKVYESLRREWEGNEASIGSLSYEQVQHLPLMMQLIQLDLAKLSKDELVML